jgi:hypothetical protein
LDGTEKKTKVFQFPSDIINRRKYRREEETANPELPCSKREEAYTAAKKAFRIIN